jgi:predicted nucleic acid-binding protein
MTVLPRIFRASRRWSSPLVSIPPRTPPATSHLSPCSPWIDRIWDSATGIFRDLRRAGLRIGLPDTLIAATALDYGLPLVTDNAEHFKRVRGLKVYTF